MSRSETSHNPFSLIADFDGDISNLFNIEVDSQLPILPLRNMVLFPGVLVPVVVGRQQSLRLTKKAMKTGCYIGVVCQKDSSVDSPRREDLYDYGTVAKVVKIFELPDSTTTVILQGFCRFRLGEITKNRFYMVGEVTRLTDELPQESDKEFKALAEACRDLTLECLKLNENLRQEAVVTIRNINNDIFLVNFICTNLPFGIEEKDRLLQIDEVKVRAYQLLGILNREAQFGRLKEQIQNKTREELDQQQKEYFLQQQIKNIQSELGEAQNTDVVELREKAKQKEMPQNVQALFEKEVGKLEHINPQSPDYNVQLNYLSTLTALPWGTYTTDNLDIKHAERTLNRDHYGLEKVKERILEHLAVLKLRGDMKSPIICLYGPPGVGKTSLGRSIADALNRKYVRISLGGVHDEAEIRGHRRTYIGAMPGRIIKSLIKAESGNPVFILDEIDKVSSNNFNGDPQSALLEVLDPEQNDTFHDNYLDVDYDLSKILFIATANSLNTIPGPLLDRMELIEVSGYLTEEKMEIARRHLLPRKLSENGFDPSVKIKLTPAALEMMIEKYTRESGVRQLEKQIDKLLRKIAFDCLKKGETIPNMTIKPADIENYLGKPLFSRDKYQGNSYAGVVTGLAWTAVGGEILFVETSLSRGKSAKLTLTGNLGDVMKESAVLALEYIKTHAERLNIDYRIFEHWNIHIHVPEGAVPKDGPSAGITIATSVASALTQRKVRERLAMTGEITLRGKVLPVGGIKEKILAAKRAGIKDIIMSRENKKDIDEISEIYLDGLTFHYVDDVMDVLDFALLDEKVAHPVIFDVEDEKSVK